MSVGSSIVRTATALPWMPAYVWDLYKLGDLVSNETRSLSLGGNDIPTNRKSVSINYPWKRLFASSFQDDSGSNIYNRLGSFYPITLENHPLYSQQTYSGNFSFNPLININLNDIDNLTFINNGIDLSAWSDQIFAECMVYLACRTPMFPLMICSSINSHYSYGPIFLNRINFSVTGGDSLSAVKVDCNFIGGKYLISPAVTLFDQNFITRSAKAKPGIEPIVYNQMEDLQGNPIAENAGPIVDPLLLINGNYDYHRYRSASLLDFMIDYNYHSNILSLRNYIELNYALSPPAYKITSFSMAINQNYSMEFTQPYSNGDYQRDDIGPKFASLSSREVSGSITYFSFNKTIEIPNTSKMTVYFGGPFFFAMEYVDWSNPTVSINPGGGYTHSYNWKARVKKGTKAPNNDMTTVMSEFSENIPGIVQTYLNYIANNNKPGYGIIV